MGISPGFSHHLECVKWSFWSDGCVCFSAVLPLKETAVPDPTVLGTVSGLPSVCMQQIISKVKGFSTPLPLSFFLAVSFLSSLFFSLSRFPALPCKSWFSRCSGRLLCKTSEQGWGLCWADGGVLGCDRRAKDVVPLCQEPSQSLP